MMNIEELLKQKESKTLEFKKDLSSIQPILKTVVAFANTSGGTLVIGYDAESDKITGIRDVLRAEEKLANAIADSIAPIMLPEIEIATIEEKDLLVVKVTHWRAPFYLTKQGIPNGVYIRLGSTSRPAGREIVEELQRSHLNVSYDQQAVSGLKKDALILEKVAHAFKSVDKEMNDQKLKSLGILVPSNHGFSPSIGGLILFGKEEIRSSFFPDARVKCARFKGKDKSIIIDRYEVEGSILDAVDQTGKFITRNTRMGAEIQGIKRKDIPEYPPVALREVLINALAHADYAIRGTPIQIAIFDNRLEIQNPGMLPFGYTLDDLRSGVSRIRNRVIAKVFHELQLMEEWGSGYKRVIEACKKGGYPEPQWEEHGTTMRVTFFPYKKTIKKGSGKPNLSEREKTIMNAFKKRKSLSFREIFVELDLGLSERMVRYNLNQLKEKGLLISKGRGPLTKWEKVS